MEDQKSIREPLLQQLAISYVYETYHGCMATGKKHPDELANMECTTPEQYALVMTGLWIEDARVSEDPTPYQELEQHMQSAYQELRRDVDDGCEA